MNRLVVVGTVYPGIEGFLPDYFDSLARQSYKNFDLLLANDGLDGFNPRAWLDGHHVFCVSVKGTICANRRRLIECALERGYEKILFTDCDDCLAENRIEVSQELLNQAPIVVNELDLIDVDGVETLASYFAPRFGNAPVIDENTLRSGNLMGLSNTAARVEVLHASPALMGGEAVAFDWYLWAGALHQGFAATFTAETSTRYRIYANNTAGMPQRLDQESIYNGVKVKLGHYRLMQDVVAGYSDLCDEFERIESNWQKLVWRSEYISRLREHAVENHMWWENIRPPAEVGMV